SDPTDSPRAVARHVRVPGRPWRWAAFVAAGPCGNALFGLGLLAVAPAAYPGGPPGRVPTGLVGSVLAPNGLPAAWLNFVGFLNLVLCFGNLVPTHVG